MSEKTVTQASPTTLPPSVPPSVPPARTSPRQQPKAPPTRVSTAVRPEAAVEEVDVATSERPASGADERSGAERGTSTSQKPRTKAPGPRRVRLAVSRVDPWSVMKLSFLLSIAVGIGIVVATATVWSVLNEMEVFAEIIQLIEEAEAMNQFGDLLQYLKFPRVISVAVVIAVVDIVLLTALATLGAFVYNLVAAMVGGLHLTLTDD